jgi:thiamine biosynthesis lipoprotein
MGARATTHRLVLPARRGCDVVGVRMTVVEMAAGVDDAWVIARRGQASAARAVREVLAEVDAACNPRRVDSELAGVHAARGRPVAVGPLLARVVRSALEGAARSGGVLDPTGGVTVVGTRPASDRFAGESAVDASVFVTPAWRAVEIDDRNRLRVPAGITLDIGSTGTAIGLDLAAERAAARTGGGVLVGNGSNIAVAGDAPEAGWVVAVDTADGADEVVTLRTGGMATVARSADVCSAARAGDGRSTASASGWHVVSVIGTSCGEARQLAAWAVMAEPGCPAVAAGAPFRAIRANGTVVCGNGWRD